MDGLNKYWTKISQENSRFTPASANITHSCNTDVLTVTPTTCAHLSTHFEMNVQALSGYTDPSQNVGKQTEEDFYLLVWF